MKDNRVRGFINKNDVYRQPLLFGDMVFLRNTSLTDIDTFFELNGKLFIYGEVKWAGLDLTIGQRKALERVVDSHVKGGSIATAYLANHNIEAPNPIHLKELKVEKYYWHGRWENIVGVTVNDFHSQLIAWCKEHKIDLGE